MRSSAALSATAGALAYGAGLFRGGGATSVVRLERAVPRGAVVAVTVEDAGGADRPTGTAFITSSPL